MAANEIYAYVVTGTVQTIYYELPSQFGDVENFNQLTDQQLLGYGFYPYTYTAPSYDIIMQGLGDMIYTVGESSVTGTNAVVSLSSDQIAANMAVMIAQIQNFIVLELYHTDWISVSDSGLSDNQQTAYTTLRANMLTVEAALSSYTSTQLISLNNALMTAYSDLSRRLPDFSTNITSLQTVLTSLIG